jgi:uncharacterized repeat protein (TIGR03803 family)
MKPTPRTLIQAAVCLGCLLPSSGWSQPNYTNYVQLRTFGFPVTPAIHPQASVIEGSDGKLYGTAREGGSAAGGAIFSVNKDGSGYAEIHTFTNSPSDGVNPQAAVTEGSDGALYGTTPNGGSAGMGILFKVNKDGSGYTLLHSFTNAPGDGANPTAQLIQGSDGLLYGTTTRGGAATNGTIFKLSKSGSGYNMLFAFPNPVVNGRLPNGIVEGSDGALYGTTATGGATTNGTVFKLSKDGSAFSVLYSFTGSDGADPQAAVIEGSDGKLYGTTAEGGSTSAGTVFRLNKDGTAYEVLRSFIGGAVDGADPQTGLLRASDGALYGTTVAGGTANLGTVFKVDANASAFTILHSFTNSPLDGATPVAGLIEASDGQLYGTTPELLT